MPQTYTIGGDSWQDIKNDDISGQTFRPDSTFMLEWVDLWFDKKPVVPEAVVQIFYADAFHHPFGDCLSRNRFTVASESLPGGIHHLRLSMQPWLLTKDESYCIQVGYYPPIWGGPLKWRYDAGDATYPRGIRIQSDDHGETWTDHFDDDHMFALWGTPPVAPPPPDPPIANVAIIDIEKTVTSTGMKIVVTTNVPCHLYAVYTLEKPLRHDRSTTVRGLVVPTDTQWCYVNWTENEQAEEGDTIIHTFTKEPWVSCETRYFVFRAKVDDVWVPTASPVFTVHRYTPPLGPPETEYFYPSAIAIDGYVWRFIFPDLQSWSQITRGAGTSKNDTDPILTVRQWASETEDKWVQLQRSPILFDTTLIPAGSAIDEAQLRVRYYAKGTIGDWPNFDICVVTSAPASNTELIPADFNPFGEVALSNIVTFPEWEPQHITFTLNEAGRAQVIPAGITKLGLRNYTWDCLNVAPPWYSGRAAILQCYSSRNALLERRPRLWVKYRAPL